MMVSDRSLAKLGFFFGVVGLVVAAISLWFSFMVSPWGSRNDQFCYRVEFGISCYSTLANCEDKERREQSEIIRGCEREVIPLKRSN
jgi:hypothetical protein